MESSWTRLWWLLTLLTFLASFRLLFQRIGSIGLIQNIRNKKDRSHMLIRWNVVRNVSNSSWGRTITNATTYGPLSFLTLKPLLRFLIFECYLWLFGFFNCLLTIRWINFFIMSESVLFIPKDSAVLTLINQLYTDAVIKRCSAK